MNKPRDAGASVPADLHFLTLAQASRLLETKALSPVDYVTALIARIDALDGQLNAFITRTNDLALKQARIADSEIASGRYRGPLHSIKPRRPRECPLRETRLTAMGRQLPIPKC